tara:strand:- start:994 stop:1461 length:468 start_codon:yes stop_codon:yes gene_type:complete
MPSNNVKLLEVIYKTPILKERIDESLEAGSKINAIKELRGWCETSDNPNWLTDGTRVSLRLMKNVIDRYAVRRIIRNKLTKLSEQIEKYCNAFGYDKMGSRRGAKSKDGLYTHQYSDYELIEDHLKFLVNNFSWKPSHNEYKEYNKLWRKYNEST